MHYICFFQIIILYFQNEIVPITQVLENMLTSLPLVTLGPSCVVPVPLSPLSYVCPFPLSRSVSSSWPSPDLTSLLSRYSLCSFSGSESLLFYTLSYSVATSETCAQFQNIPTFQNDEAYLTVKKIHKKKKFHPLPPPSQRKLQREPRYSEHIQLVLNNSSQVSLQCNLNCNTNCIHKHHHTSKWLQ